MIFRSYNLLRNQSTGTFVIIKAKMAASTGIVRLRSRQLNYLYRTFKALSFQENQVNLGQEEKTYLKQERDRCLLTLPAAKGNMHMAHSLTKYTMDLFFVKLLVNTLNLF